MRGNILVHNHCYRADEMATMLDIAQEFGYRISTFHHGVEAYKLADRLAAEGVCGGLWADWWGFKMEAYDGIQENLAIVDHPEGGCAIVHSDSEEGIQRLNQEAAKAMARGIRAGFDIPPERAIRWITRQSRERARHRRPDRLARARQDGGRRGLERHAVQRVCARRSGVHRRRAGLRSLEAGGQARGRISRCEGSCISVMRIALSVLVPALGAAQDVADQGRARAHRWPPPARSRTRTSSCSDGRIAEVGRQLRRPPVHGHRGKWHGPVTPGLFGGLSQIGLEEVNQEVDTVRLGTQTDGARLAAPLATGVRRHAGIQRTLGVLIPSCASGHDVDRVLPSPPTA